MNNKQEVLQMNNKKGVLEMNGMKSDMRKIIMKALPYVSAIVLFLVFSLLYCSPLLEGKVLHAGDTMNWLGAAHEVQEYKSATGETSWWTNSMFGGMPTYQITGSTASSDLRSSMEKVAHGGMYGEKNAMGLLFAYFLGFFLLLICIGVNPWLSIVGGFAIGLSTYFLLIIPICGQGYSV